jgi:hypothetical protein
MGSSHGKFVFNTDSISSNQVKLFNPNDPVPEVTSEEVKILKEMWAIVNNDISKVGVITFVR